MKNTKYISIIKTEGGVWQIKFAGLILGEYEDLQEAKDFALNYKHGKIVEVIEGDKFIEQIEK